MSDDMIKRGALAIFDAPNWLDGDTVGDMLLDSDSITGRTPEECREQIIAVCQAAARAAIEAMREPAALEAACWAAADPRTGNVCWIGVSVHRAADIVDTVLGAALAGVQKPLPNKPAET